MKIGETPPKPRPGLAGALDRFLGPGTTRAELLLELIPSSAAAVLVPLLAAWQGLDWSLLLTAVAALIAFDLVGGVITNATSAAKRWYHRPGQGFRQQFGFVAAHAIHVLLVAWLFRGQDWLYFGVVYGYLLLGTALVLWTPLYLKRPLAMLLLVGGLFINLYALSPTPGLEWFVPVFYLKLLVSHLLPEEPFQPD